MTTGGTHDRHPSDGADEVGNPFDALPDAVVVIDELGTVREVNDRCRLVLGLGPEASGRRLVDVVDLQDDAGLSVRLPPPRSRVAARHAERLVYVVEGGGRRRPVAITGRWGPQGWVMSARGAGRREVLERLRGDVVATVSHELRSPLVSVKGFTRTLIARWGRFSDEQKLAMLATIETDADRVTRLLTDLLEVSRIDAGRVRLARAPTDLGTLCATVVDKARHRHLGSERTVIADIDPATPLVSLDADRIEQVLTNLVDNALEHGRTGPIGVSVRPTGDGVRVRVTDAGPGVPEDHREAIFRKFGRGRSDRRSGTGLGLYLARGLTEAHGGRLWLEEPSDPEATSGASFVLWLPASRAVDAP